MHEFPIIELGGLSFDLSSIIAIVVSTVICMVLGVLATRKLSVANPSKMQNFMEWTLEFVHNTVASTMPLDKAKKFINLAATLIMFIFVSNLLGLPFGVTFDAHHEVKWGNVVVVSQELVDEKGGAAHIAFWKSPTADIAVTSGLAIVSFFLIHFLGLKMNAKHYIKHYFKPFWIFFPLNIVEQVARPVSLALRLYANIFAGEVLISTILMLKWFGIPLLAVWQGFSIFVGAIQAFLFTVLTMVYISQAIVHEEHEEH
ncbi:F0F1 ATP synthase subunit A [Paenibacillus pinihumi]|uniref:F0F1 ATP synthase subunit A n=1 Tax=Paenibacillus pinihumi TaxID=669462 RepID=UPI0003FFF5A1|nr:F0F1 ATP synthase subunit A [Paenibacillus pinihumi]